MIQDLLIILISSSLVNNVVLSQFLGLCPFLGVSKKTNTAAGMGVAVIFVITLASAVSGVIYKFILEKFDVTYLQTIVFILVIAALVQFVEIYASPLSGAGRISAVDYNELRGFGHCPYQRAEKIRHIDRHCKRVCHCGRVYYCYCHFGGNP